MKKKFYKYFLIFEIFMCTTFLFSGCTISISKKYNEVVDSIQNEVIENTYSDPFEYLEKTYKEGEQYISSKEEINLKNSDGKKKNYTFVYNGELYTAIYTKDNWHINDSYKIRNKKDIALICQALIDVHPVHGADMKSYRTADDMMYEWVQHNIAYDYLPDGNSWKSHAKDVDLNAADQGKSIKEMYETRAK